MNVGQVCESGLIDKKNKIEEKEEEGGWNSFREPSAQQLPLSSSISRGLTGHVY
jgi:hypothetical protein